MDKVFRNNQTSDSGDSLEKLKKFIENQDNLQYEAKSNSNKDEDAKEKEKYSKLFREIRQKYNLEKADNEAEEYLANKRDIAEYNRWSLKICQKWLLAFYNDKFWTNMGISLLKYKYILDQEVINLQVCKDFIEGYYLPNDKKIILCANNLTNYEKNYRFNHAVKRHLILMYDHLRSSNYDHNNCQHLACSEVRAAKLSGYCKHSYSYFNAFYAQERNETLLKNCVKTKAVEHMNTYYEHCSNDCKKNVDFVFEKCYQDNVPIYDFQREKNFINKF
jgi:hypothetical protein